MEFGAALSAEFEAALSAEFKGGFQRGLRWLLAGFEAAFSGV